MATDYVMFDPPSGWLYGFPKPIHKDDLKDLRRVLQDANYPEKDIPLALNHSRYWSAE